ncbi:hypothetical protein PC9H_007945 [Pleurotus ostreatus]|uniref:DM2 domain-containing protein n=2 Tax=Pleurotus ostreatus TaxID=5322 RepID=A0A067NJQ9_PLEO1|nr:uncharacterized protein PC9H_007945 [Pleurotus ostreatus]KAF7428716.1 hypothetical protein PC9H_007945 [Pleurotus ostreatus]KAJ8696911.1 hypothetical protein PTI98_006734 [Pleurotus ostreatus]KDQ28184.1 hypothetical protein PLEOSDRAFT_167937 [Pleurotus ostreatus PC15]
MGFDFNSLEPLIKEILSAPGTDLNTISAKRVRRQLTELDPSLTSEFMKENKEDVDLVIARVYESVREPGGDDGGEDHGEGASDTSRKRKQSEQSEDYGENGEEEAGDEDEEAESAPPAKKAKKGKKELSDEQLARQISNEINGGGRRSATRSARATSGTPKKPRKRKSAAIVDSDDGSDAGDKPKAKSAARGGFAKDPPLASLLAVDKLSRPQVVKQLWVYIKANDLQNPSNKKEIICDAPMKAIFKSDKIDMFSMNKYLGSHLYKDAEEEA